MLLILFCPRGQFEAKAPAGSGYMRAGLIVDRPVQASASRPDGNSIGRANGGAVRRPGSGTVKRH